MSKQTLSILLVLVSLAGGIALFFCGPIRQDESFHHFADTRNIFSISNFWNVISNLAFFFIGLAALEKLIRNKLSLAKETKAAYYIFFTGVLLVGFGSASYHYDPNNTTLVWDRLPMTISFMSLLSIGLSEFLDVKAGRTALIPFLLTGLFSIAWWQYGELQNKGDLRLYALVQFLPIVLLALLLFFCRSIYKAKWGYLILFGAYVLAKLAEHFDKAVYKFTNGAVAGHVIKHITTAAGVYFFLLYLQKRKIPVNGDHVLNHTDG